MVLWPFGIQNSRRIRPSKLSFFAVFLVSPKCFYSVLRFNSIEHIFREEEGDISTITTCFLFLVEVMVDSTLNMWTNQFNFIERNFLSVYRVLEFWNWQKNSFCRYLFHSQSRVTSVSFGKFHPNLILGGTYSGQICLWDNRQHKKTPVQKVSCSTFSLKLCLRFNFLCYLYIKAVFLLSWLLSSRFWVGGYFLLLLFTSSLQLFSINTS